MTSYQRLKGENKNLKQDIYKILDKNDDTIFFWTRKKELEKMFMYGSPIKIKRSESQKYT